MKALLTLLLLISLAVNVILVTGCASVDAPRLYSPTTLLDKGIRDKFVNQLADNPEQQSIFQTERSLLESLEGKIVIVLDNTEENRTAKTIRVRFTD